MNMYRGQTFRELEEQYKDLQEHMTQLVEEMKTRKEYEKMIPKKDKCEERPDAPRWVLQLGAVMKYLGWPGVILIGVIWLGAPDDTKSGISSALGISRDENIKREIEKATEKMETKISEARKKDLGEILRRLDESDRDRKALLDAVAKLNVAIEQKENTMLKLLLDIKNDK